MRWANPPLSLALEKLIIEYCDHLMGENPNMPFPKTNLLNAWENKYKATKNEKAFYYM